MEMTKTRMQGKRIIQQNQSDVIYRLRKRIEDLNDDGILSNPRRLELIQKLAEAEEHYLQIDKILAVIKTQIRKAIH